MAEKVKPSKQKIEMMGQVVEALPGTQFKVEVSTYDLSRGRIVYRYKRAFGSPRPSRA